MFNILDYYVFNKIDNINTFIEKFTKKVKQKKNIKSVINNFESKDKKYKFNYIKKKIHIQKKIESIGTNYEITTSMNFELIIKNIKNKNFMRHSNPKLDRITI